MLKIRNLCKEYINTPFSYKSSSGKQTIDKDKEEFQKKY